MNPEPPYDDYDIPDGFRHLPWEELPGPIQRKITKELES